jgi:hypothetical protein
MYDQHSPVPDTHAIRRRIESITQSRGPVSITDISGGTSQASTNSSTFKLYRYALAPQVPLWMHCIHPYSFSHVLMAVTNRAESIFGYCKSKIGLARDYTQKLDTILQDLRDHGDHPVTAPCIFTYEKFQWFSDFPVGPYDPAAQNKVARVEAIFDNQESISLTCLALARMAEDRYNVPATRRSASWYLESLSKALCLQQQHHHFHTTRYTVKEMQVPPELQIHLAPRIQMGPPPPRPPIQTPTPTQPQYTIPPPQGLGLPPQTPSLPMIPYSSTATNPPPQAIIVMPPMSNIPITLPLPHSQQQYKRMETNTEFRISHYRHHDTAQQ